MSEHDSGIVDFRRFPTQPAHSFCSDFSQSPLTQHKRVSVLKAASLSTQDS